MKPESERTVSSWMATAATPPLAPLDHDAQADVCVVGAGIAGLSTAYLLASAGKSVLVVDDGPVGGGQSQRTTAQLPHLPASFDGGPCLRFPRQGQFHPLKYLSGLAAALRKKGGHIFTGTHAQRISGGFVPVVETARGPKVTCSAVVVATNTPVNDR